MSATEYKDRLLELWLSARTDGSPSEFASALSRAVDAAKTFERQSNCRHARACVRYGSDHHGEIEISECRDCRKVISIN